MPVSSANKKELGCGETTCPVLKPSSSTVGKRQIVSTPNPFGRAVSCLPLAVTTEVSSRSELTRQPVLATLVFQGQQPSSKVTKKNGFQSPVIVLGWFGQLSVH